MDAGSFLAVNGVKLNTVLLSAVLQQPRVCVGLGESGRGSPRVELSAQTRAALCLEAKARRFPLGRRASTRAAPTPRWHSRALGTGSGCALLCLGLSQASQCHHGPGARCGPAAARRSAAGSHSSAMPLPAAACCHLL